MDSITDKQCCNCGEVKDKSEFPIAKNRKDGRGTWCKACMRVYSQEHYKNNRLQVLIPCQWNKVRDSRGEVYINP